MENAGYLAKNLIQIQRQQKGHILDHLSVPGTSTAHKRIPKGKKEEVE